MPETPYGVRVCAAIRRSGDEILVVREVTRGREVLNLPGGRPQFDESLESALVREVAEETGYAILPTDIAYVSEQRGSRWDNLFLEVCFYAEIVGTSSKRAANRLGETVKGCVWLGPSDPQLRLAVPGSEFFLESRKGRYLRQRRQR